MMMASRGSGARAPEASLPHAHVDVPPSPSLRPRTPQIHLRWRRMGSAGGKLALVSTWHQESRERVAWEEFGKGRRRRKERKPQAKHRRELKGIKGRVFEFVSESWLKEKAGE
ncbi:hypothetical protein EW146_g9335 [Bondarzewia mesenterica]|uniref:Uncharacterized protein n=1 Tax=Bondarzewia mesenterica TaxID=1095465 RepID=A0A4S4L947_9AGAM|nr:hypothetical protein EW146_g9335 [Bondarzewia mesenterica]